MKIDQPKISIPWYRRRVRSTHSLQEGVFNSGVPMIPKFPRSRVRTPHPKQEKVRVRVPVTVPEGSLAYVYDREGQKVGNQQDIKSPSLFPEGFKLPESFKNPFGSPFPERPGQTKPELPNGLPPLTPVYNNPTVTSSDWRKDFVQDVNFIATSTGKEAKQLYSFIANYDMNELTIGNFYNEAMDEFGMVAAILLSAMITAKYFTQLWGKRVAMGFSPILNEDNEYFEKMFGKVEF